jgi:aryl-alcohol dehydrogenase-like predicted oxidoreductase/uncharacterized protein YdeI (YjbR/CyaY-like superfamily)
MNTRPLGRTGIHVSPYALGTMRFGQAGNTDHDECVRIIHRALDAGINLIDTADVYGDGDGESERIVGKALRGRRRDEVVLATKVNGRMGPGPNQQGSSRRWIVSSVEASLRRLGVDHIDLYQMHHPDPDTDIEETLSALTDLLSSGKVRAIGHSNLPPSQIVEAQWVSERRGLARFRTEQPHYSILNRGAEREIFPVCQAHGLGTLVWSPMAMGLLTGRYRRRGGETASAAQLRWVPRHMTDDRKLDAVEALLPIADRPGYPCATSRWRSSPPTPRSRRRSSGPAPWTSWTTFSRDPPPFSTTTSWTAWTRSCRREPTSDRWTSRMRHRPCSALSCAGAPSMTVPPPDRGVPASGAAHEHLLMSHAPAWRAWLDVNEDASNGVWLVLAKKGTASPTTLTHARALDEALCSGWIDGQRRRRDAVTFLQRFTPRRRGSIWSQRNVGLVATLDEQGRLRQRGRAEIDQARLDGRWDRAYAGSAAAEVPEDLAAVVAASPRATARFTGLTAGERYPLLLRIMTAAPDVRAQRISALVARLEEAETARPGTGSG